MNRKLGVTAMGLALAATIGVANAEVALYGQVDLSAGPPGQDDLCL